ncbi:helix-turn-helix domain-containing protein [Streptomyces sp. NPDC006879]|uniref:helix-turn-helix domain-containing protein n=1 Tax=Streptomyces sp. NPDC006879 TaxID=3364767 RepID=UPI003680C4A0
MTASTRTIAPHLRSADTALPSPAERKRLRESWALTPQQVAEAFGVTPSTVRSWECGRTSPTGQRRTAYARFLLGLAQEHLGSESDGVDVPEPRRPRHTTSLATPEARYRDTAPAPVSARPVPCLPTAPTPSSTASTTLRPARTRWSAVPVGRLTSSTRWGANDPVSYGRRRRLAYAACAWLSWVLALYLVLTMPVGH